MSTASPTDRPSDGAILERALSLANEAMFTVKLQHRRLRSTEPEDEVFFFRRGADFQFLIVALRRMRRAAELAAKVTTVSAAVQDALVAFDHDLPMLLTMRNVGEHVDDYAVDDPKRRHKQVSRRQLQAGSWDGTTFSWLEMTLNTDVALKAAWSLLSALRAAVKTMKQWIFAYGSNMCVGRLRAYGVVPEDPGVAHQLDGYILRFNKESSDGSGKANVEPFVGSSVWGVLYSITQEELEELNAREKGYTPVRIPVRNGNGEAHACMHIADRTVDGLRPYSWYKRFLVEGARAHGLPDEYVAVLEAIQSTGDPNRTRDTTRRSMPCDQG